MSGALARRGHEDDGADVQQVHRPRLDRVGARRQLKYDGTPLIGENSVWRLLLSLAWPPGPLRGRRGRAVCGWDGVRVAADGWTGTSWGVGDPDEYHLVGPYVVERRLVNGQLALPEGRPARDPGRPPLSSPASSVSPLMLGV